MSNTLFSHLRAGGTHTAEIKSNNIQGYNIQDIAKRLKEISNIKDYLVEGGFDGAGGIFLNFAKLMGTDIAKNNNSDDEEISKALTEVKQENGIYKIYGSPILEKSHQEE